MSKVSSYVYNPVCEKTGHKDLVRVDSRTAGELCDDRMVKWFDSIAVTGATVDQSYIMKDFEKVVIDGRTLSEFVREDLDEGDTFKMQFEHVEPTTALVYRLYAEGYKEREDSKNCPCIVCLTRVIIEKVYNPAE